jgi:hypothetical protein
MNEPVNVQQFGAVLTATPAQTNDAFERAMQAARDSGHYTVHIPARNAPYTFAAPLAVSAVQLRGETQNLCRLHFPAGSVPEHGHAITLSGFEVHKIPSLYSLTISGPGVAGGVGSTPADFHGVRCGTPELATGAGGPIAIHDCYVSGFKYGIVWDNHSGHISHFETSCIGNYYGIYVRRGTGDYHILGGGYTDNKFASIGLPRNTGLSRMVITRAHLGYAPYGIYQSNVDDPVGALGDKMTGFLNQCTFLSANFEGIGNAAILSDADPSGNSGTMWGCFFVNCEGTWHPNPAYTLPSRDKNYWMVIPNALQNHIHWGAFIWPHGDLGLFDYGGIGAWYIYGDASWPNPGGVVMNGPTTHNRLLSTEHVNTSVTGGVPFSIAAGETSATFTYNDWQKAAASAFLPVLTPHANPGSHWWVSGLSSIGFTVNLASPAPAGGVPFSVHLQS